MKLGYTGLLLLAVTAVAIADVFLKKASVGHTFIETLKSPWMIGTILLYFFQIFFFAYVFVAGVQLVNVGILQTALYAVIVLTAGFLFFNETLSMIQIVGAILTFIGIALINLK